MSKNEMKEGSPPDAETDKKRRRSEPDDELEIDVNLPEPPSKKAKRREKKASTKSKTPTTGDDTTKATHTPSKPADSTDDLSDLRPAAPPTSAEEPKRSEHGIWIGNLPFHATRDTLRTFLLSQASIPESDIVRLNLPGPTKKSGSNRANEQQNRGFAYIDFTTAEVAEKAIALSEKLVLGRRCLIKDAKSFEGRPVKKEEEATGEKSGGAVKEPTKKVFIGNLGFDVTKEDIVELYAPAGEVEDVFLATFEDSGKCKGFGWVRFESVGAAEAAVKGFLYRETVDGEDEAQSGSGSDEVEIKTEKKSKPKPKREKVWVNRIQGRDVRCEFAEDAQTRYKKRWGKGKEKDATSNGNARGDRREPTLPNGDSAVDEFGRTKFNRREGPSTAPAGAPREYKPKPDGKPKPKQTADERSKERRKRHDARTVAPGQALANTQRATGAIVAGKGTKVTFD